MSEIKLNLKGMQCPGPIMEVFKASKKAESGDTIIATVSDRGFEKDIQAWAKKTGNEILDMDVTETEITAKIKIK